MTFYDSNTCACRRVVGDLMRNAGHRLESVTDLDSYIRRPRGIMGHVQARTTRMPYLALSDRLALRNNLTL